MSVVNHVRQVEDEMARAISAAGAGGERIGYAVCWSPAEVPGGKACAWMFMLTIPSLLLGQPPLAVTAGPLICPSVPAPAQISQVIRSVLPVLRKSLQQMRDDAARAEPVIRAAR